MINIKKAKFEHFEDIYILLKQLGNNNIKKNDWKNIFVNHFNSGENYFGYILIDDNKIKGFIGLIISKRFINNQQIKFANIGNWIVEKKYRNKSINLLLPILKMKNVILTNFTASSTVSSILKTLNFNELGDSFYIIPPLPTLSKYFMKNNYKIFYNKSVKEKLSLVEKNIYKDHSKPDFNINHILIKNDSVDCYIIAKKAYRNKMPFLHILYISNPKIFNNSIHIFKLAIAIKFQVVSLIIDERLLRKEKIKFAFSYKLQSPRFYKLNGINYFNELEYLDHLYSEFILLSI